MKKMLPVTEREREYGGSRLTNRTEPLSKFSEDVLKGSVSRARDENKATMQLSGQDEVRARTGSEARQVFIHQTFPKINQFLPGIQRKLRHLPFLEGNSNTSK